MNNNENNKSGAAAGWLTGIPPRIAQLLLIKETERRQLPHFLLLFLVVGAGMALGRGSADALFLKRYGIEYLPFMYLALSVLLMIVSTIYMAFSDRLPAERFFRILFATLIALLIGNWMLMSFLRLESAYPLYFLLYEVASELLLVHAMLYLGQNFETLQIKRLIPIVLAASQTGTILGGLVLAGIGPVIGVQNLLLVWSALLGAALILLSRHHRHYGVSPHFRAARKSRARMRQAVEQVVQGIRFLRQSELLRSISIALFFMVITFYVLSYSVNRIYTNTFRTEEELTAFFGVLTASTSTIALMLQLFVTNRVLRRFGVKKVNLVFPVTTLVSFLVLASSFLLPSAILASMNKDAIMPAIRNPVRNLFFNALPSYMQGRARAMSVALVLPVALAVTGILLVLTQRVDNPLYFLVIGIATGCGYLYYSLRMNRAYVTGIISVLKERVLLPVDGQPLLDGNDGDIVAALERGVRHPNDDISLAYSKALLEHCPEHAAAIILPRLRSAEHRVSDQMLRHLSGLDPVDLDSYLLAELDRGDDHLRATMMTVLINRGNPAIREHIRAALDSPNPRLAATGIYGASVFPDLQLGQCAEERFTALLSGSYTEGNIAALELLARQPDTRYQPRLLSLLSSQNARILKAALDALYNWPVRHLPGLYGILHKMYEYPDSKIRAACIRNGVLLSDDERMALAQAALDDDYPEVQGAAVETLFYGHQDFVHETGAWIIGNRVSPRAQRALLTVLLEHQPPPDLLEEIAYSKAIQSHAMASAGRILCREGMPETGNAALKLMPYLLGERQHQTMELVLQTMRPMEDSEVIDTIDAGLKSGDPRHVAAAGEALRYISNREHINLLGELIDDVRHPSAEDVPGDAPFRTRQEVLQWCCRQADPWLIQCAEHALGGLQSTGEAE